MRRRVVVTGYGCVSALGVGVEPFWRALAAGRGGFRVVTPEFSQDSIQRLAGGARVDAALAGGTEACITWGCLKAWEALRVLARDALRPFSAQRSGLVLGEGAGILVLEEREQAIARGADILAEIIGYGASSDAADMVHPSDEGAALAMSRALDDAGVSPTEIDYVSAHGSGTPAQ